MPSKWGLGSTAALWSVVLGGLGFACGFVGPIAFHPEANQGPLLGIFITGPVGLVGGAILGVIAYSLRRLMHPPALKLLVPIGAAWTVGLLVWILRDW